MDVKGKMLKKLRKLPFKAGLEERLDMRVAGRAPLGIDDISGSVDFALASAAVHKVPGQAGLCSANRPGNV